MKRSRRRQRAIRQWTWLVCALLAVTALLSWTKVLWRMDLAIYDAALPTGPAPDDVVIVAIDDASVAALGRWPWSRQLHALLLDRLREQGAQAVALDILFTEPDVTTPDGDAELAAAMRRGPPTVLPLLVEMHGSESMHERPPIASLSAAAASIGHAHLELDRDGVARSVFLREGVGAPTHPQLALALLQSLPEARSSLLPGVRHPDLHNAPQVWVRDYRILIPFLGPPGHFNRLSYIDVLNGRIAPDALRGKLVLVGATAQGIGDTYPTPRSGQSVAMPGVEITANVLQALRDGKVIQDVPMPMVVALSLAPLLIVAFGLLRYSPRQSLAFAVLMSGVTFTGSVLALRLAGWWWPPAAALTGLVVIYPLWSWRRLEATQAYLEEEIAQLAGEPLPFLGAAPPRARSRRLADPVERRIDIVHQAAQRSRGVRRLFADMISGLPNATLLVDLEGRIALANPAAAKLFELTGREQLEGTSVDSQLLPRVAAADLDFEKLASEAPAAIETVLTNSGRNILVRTVPFLDGSRARAGTIIDLTDITELRVAQREREDALRFLSHDMKSPASSLLGLAQLQRDPARALPPAELSQRLDLLAQRMLALADGFVALARAESSDSRGFTDFDLRDAAQDAYDEVWAAATARRMRMTIHTPADEVFVYGERSLLARAAVNLLSNAVKFSPQGSHVRISVERIDREAVIRVADEGPGIDDSAQSGLFQRFNRRKHRGPGDPGGAGLGLAFVRVVADKHRGRAWAERNIERGCVFSLAIPLASAPTGD
ncbi:MAG: CHASE2 domain-containing protein [Pseudomonadota bacterium]|nr:CHASE2 domain-containing protein [Pseudomonadota bacterium]